MSDRDRYGGDAAAAHPSTRVIQTRVVDNCDRAGLGRVMVEIPWIDGPVPASVVTGAAGNDRGMFFIPQKDDEVLVLVKDQPDLTAYVIGSLWTSKDTPPRREPDAASKVQLIRTPGGHEIVFDDQKGELVISTKAGQKISLSKQKVEIRSSKESSAAVITLGQNGDVTVSGNSIKVQAKQNLKLSGASIDIQADGECTIHGSMVRINDPSPPPPDPPADASAGTE